MNNPYYMKGFISLAIGIIFMLLWFVRVPLEVMDSFAGLVTGVLLISGLAWINLGDDYKNEKGR